MVQTLLMFAYGSNMYKPELQHFLKDCRITTLGPALSLGHRWQMQSLEGIDDLKANLVPEKNATTLGVLYLLDNCNLELLNKKEGLRKKLYRCQEMEVYLCKNMKPHKAYTYVMNPKKVVHDDGKVVAKGYWQKIKAGFQQNQIPKAYYKHLVQNFQKSK